MKGFNKKSEIPCVICLENATKQNSTKGEPVINAGVPCVNLSGERQIVSRLSPLMPELADLPTSNFCMPHLRAKRRAGEGEWMTVVDAAKMIEREKRKRGDLVAVENNDVGSNFLDKMKLRYIKK